MTKNSNFLTNKHVLWLAATPAMVVQFYLPHLRTMMAAGARVSLASNFNGAADKKKLLEKMGVACFSLPIRRGGKNIMGEGAALLALWRLVARQRPDMINALALKMVLYGGLVARCKNINFLGNLTGLGFIFISKTIFARVVRVALKIFLPFIFSTKFSTKHKKLLVMNHDDFSLMTKKFFIKPKNIICMLGVGVDDNYFTPRAAANSKNKPTIVTMARLLRDKGIVEFCHAAKLVKEKHRDVNFLIYGASDAANPSCLSPADINELKKCGVVFMGHTANSKQALAQADAVALFSYREGLPQVLLEAAAMGKCLIALDAPGSREICRNNISGLLVENQKQKTLVPAMAAAMEKILQDKNLREKLGRGARVLVEKQFSLKIIEQQMLALWKSFF